MRAKVGSSQQQPTNEAGQRRAAIDGTTNNLWGYVREYREKSKTPHSSGGFSRISFPILSAIKSLSFEFELQIGWLWETCTAHTAIRPRSESRLEGVSIDSADYSTRDSIHRYNKHISEPIGRTDQPIAAQAAGGVAQPSPATCKTELCDPKDWKAPFSPIYLSIIIKLLIPINISELQHHSRVFHDRLKELGHHLNREIKKEQIKVFLFIVICGAREIRHPRWSPFLPHPTTLFSLFLDYHRRPPLPSTTNNIRNQRAHPQPIAANISCILL